MAFWKRRSRGSFAPSSNDRFAVVYLGRHSVVDNTGLDQASTALDTLYRNYKDGKEQAQRVTVEVIVNGLVINKIKGFSSPTDSSASSDNRTLLTAAKMYFGATDPSRPKIFFIVKRTDDDTNERDKYECHAFLCDTPTAAKSLALQLVEMFNNIGDTDTQLAYRKSYEYAMMRSNQQQLREKGLLRSQSLNLPRLRGRPEAVAVLKITMNVEHVAQFGLITEANNNSDIARIVAKRDSEQSSRSGAADYQIKDNTSSTIGGSNQPPSSRDEKDRGDHAGRTKHRPIVAFNLQNPESPNKLLRESQLSTVKEQSPSPSPKQSPKERKIATKKADDSKENQQVEEELSERANKRKSVRFADDTEII